MLKDHSSTLLIRFTHQIVIIIKAKLIPLIQSECLNIENICY